MVIEPTVLYIAKYGDFLAKIAAEHGTTWQAIWDHPLNADHRRKRGSPDVLYPGDALHIPRPEPDEQPPPPAPPQPPTSEPPPGSPPVPTAVPPPWPYPAPPEPLEPLLPSWDCPGGLCVCRNHQHVQPKARRLRFFDHLGQPMRGARCRVSTGARLLNVDAPYADDRAELAVEVPGHAKTLGVEWAPASMPVAVPYPYRTYVYLDMAQPTREGVRRRLHNLGFKHAPTVMGNLREFWTLYRSGLAACASTAEEILGALQHYHDSGELAPLPLPEPPPSPAPEPPVPAREELVRLAGSNSESQPQQTERTDARLAARPSPSDQLPVGTAQVWPWPDNAWFSPQPAPLSPDPAVITVAPLGFSTLRVRVRTRHAGPLAGATVVLTSLGTQTQSTGPDGEVVFPPLFPGAPARVTVFHRHHGPDPGPGGTVETGPVSVVVLGWVPLQLPQQSLPSVSVTTVPGFPGEAILDVALMDAAMNLGSTTPSKAARALTDEEVRQELLSYVRDGDVELTATTGFRFEHDPNSGMLDPCTNVCRIIRPGVHTRVAIPHTLQPARIAGVDMVYLNRPNPASETAQDHGGSHFARDALRTAASGQLHLHPANTRVRQRLVVGLVRLCKLMRDTHQIRVIYHGGLLTAHHDAHGDGSAVDVRGFATDPAPSYGRRFNARLMVDFVVLLHWGRLPSWDPATTQVDPDPYEDDPAPPSWQRLAGPDMTTDFRNQSPNGPLRLRFRLLGLPVNVPIEHMVRARQLFADAFDFFVREFTDRNVLLPAADDRPPPAIDTHDAENVIHPDHANPGLRTTHDDHFHVQFGATHP